MTYPDGDFYEGMQLLSGEMGILLVVSDKIIIKPPLPII